MQEVILSGSALTGIAPHLMSVGNPPSNRVFCGRNRPRARPYAPVLEAYFNTVLGAPPESVDYFTKAQQSIVRVYLNDRLGCCVISGKYHAVGVWTANDTPTTVLGTDTEVLNSYHGICGPGDNGCNIANVLNYFKSPGLLCNGVRHTIAGYVQGNWTNKLEVMVGLYLFACGSIGINLPQAWTQNAIWDVTNTPIVGGHDVTIVGYNAQGVQVSSWGRIYTITWAAFMSKKWLEELYWLLSPDWYNNDKLAPNGINAAVLMDDLKKIGGGTIPPIDPTMFPWESILPHPNP